MATPVDPPYDQSAPLRGSSDNVLDPKGRLTIPARFRDRVIKDNRVVLSVGFMSRLAIYHPDTWNSENARMNRLLPDPAFELVSNASTTECEVDAQFRVRIPVKLRGDCNLANDEVTVVGNGMHIMVWDSKEWEDFSARVRHAMATRKFSPET